MPAYCRHRRDRVSAMWLGAGFDSFRAPRSGSWPAQSDPNVPAGSLQSSRPGSHRLSYFASAKWPFVLSHPRPNRPSVIKSDVARWPAQDDCFIVASLNSPLTCPCQLRSNAAAGFSPSQPPSACGATMILSDRTCWLTPSIGRHRWSKTQRRACLGSSAAERYLMPVGPMPMIWKTTGSSRVSANCQTSAGTFDTVPGG